ncbi:DUF3572 family protein [Aurantiacibacter sediminis]|uniref:DUF3572 family protein n=1 Tax=Aurantiacibacter sediminis TaxID=2793064 RepID=A0ABS0N3I8_9SPHN|nr:DUF3572 family protein [Aurantiacibacter sediminis]MBH5321569.1 DUF3572 family protein [Aurantiacibacter sediminis]
MMSADASALALAALGWIMQSDDRAHRFLDLTGLTPDGLRAAIGDEATHRAVFEFLAAYEPDLIAAANALNVQPETFARAHREIGA